MSLRVVLALAGLLTASPALACYLENFDYKGFDVDRLEGKVYSAKACQIQCIGNPECYFWTYQPSTLSCYMKSRDAEGQQTAEVGLISGPKVCPDPEECFEENIDLQGDDIINMEVISAVACQYQCKVVNGCSFWTFVPSANRCYLKGTGVVPTASEGLISGPRSCTVNNNLCESSTDYYGHDIEKLEGTVPDALTCQKLCVGFINCFYWTFVESTSSCYLKSKDGNEGRQPNPLAISGTTDCTMPDRPATNNTSTATCFESNINYSGTDLSSFGRGPMSDAAACQLLCQHTPECQYFTFLETVCYLKDGRAPNFSESKEGAVSGPRYCGTSSTSTSTTSSAESCFSFNIDYLGTDVDVAGQGPVADHYACQQMCQSNSLCMYFTYFQGVCYLKNENAPKYASPKVNAISGPKFCDTKTTTTTASTNSSIESAVETLLKFLRVKHR